jgi:ABC-type multidrug transport system ATPase subunit
MDDESSLVVCPACRYGFPESPQVKEQYECPRSECGHQWEAISQTVRAVHSRENREAHPELRLLAGAEPFWIELAEGETFIGRDSDCGFRLDNRNVSRRHARVIRRGEDVSIEDLGSSWGTMVNGQHIDQKTELRPCDELLIGGITIQFAVRFEGKAALKNLVDSTIVVKKGAKSAPQVAGYDTEVITLEQQRITFGRSAARDVVLPDAMISGRHAYVERIDDGYYLSDTQSQIGSYVNGKSIIRERLHAGDRVQLGPYLFRFEGDRLVRVLQPTSFGLVAQKITKTIGSITLLDHIDLVLQPAEFVGLLGPSGAGKTTLLDALNGLRPATSGAVLVNGEPLYEQYDRLRHHIGYVPQEDIIHRELTVREALVYAGRLRLPADVSEAELSGLVDETLDSLQLTERADVPIAKLSGGQRKRASVGVELLGKPGILFLDEPTSGLDPGTETRLMRIFRRLADQSRTVVCTTHVMENVDLFHKLVVLAAGGRLAYFGPPSELKGYFGIDAFTNLYERMEEKPATDWQRRYRKSDLCRKLLKAPATAKQQRKRKKRRRLAPAPPSSAIGQWATLSRRFLAILGSDRTNLAILFAQPLVITGLICMVCKDLPLILFLLVISALWFGCSSAAQQIVKERTIYQRDRMVNLRLDSYLLSKFLPLGAMTLLQCLLMLAIVWLLRGVEGMLLVHFAALALAAWNGVALGLVISSLASNADKAMSVVPLTLIPQIILAGVLVALPEMNAGTRVLSYLMASRWSNQAVEIGILDGKTVNEELLKEKENVRPLWNLFPDYDLAQPEDRATFLKDKGGSEINERSRLVVDFSILCCFILVQLIVTTIVLRSQDTV